jgi:hypothetical protein
MVFRGVCCLLMRFATSVIFGSLDGCASLIPFKLELPFQTFIRCHHPSITLSAELILDIVHLFFPSISCRTVVDRSVASKTSCLY